MINRKRLQAAIAIAAIVLGAGALRADEGFWPFNAVPRAAVKQAYGFDVTDEWLRHLQLASVRFGGASGSFVSPDGLVMTNHHVGLGTLQKLSTPERDLVQRGFYARTRSEELKAPDMELNVLVGIEDVTARVNAAVTAGMPAADAFSARRAAITSIEQDSTKATSLKSEVVTLYQGALYHLYRYRRYTDVRLVFAPEFDIAFFGGDTDNFTYPRYCLDLTVFRVYENDQPARTEHYLRWAPAGAEDGELVFTSGHPGTTQRLNTVAHLEYLRDHGIPLSISLLERRRDVLVKYGARGPEQTRQVKDEMFGLENSLKSYRGQLGGLKDPGLMEKKQAAERALQQAVAADPAKKKEFGDPWAAIVRARGPVSSYLTRYTMVEGGAGFTSRLFSLARTIVRLGDESGKPDADRLPEFTDARRASLERQLYSPAPIYKAADEAKLADALTLLASTLGADDPVVRASLQGKTPGARAAELVSGTALADVAARKALVAGGATAVAASTDPMVVLARAVDPEARTLRTRYENEVLSVERDAYTQIARAIFATQGAGAYPDATSTLRLSYGTVKGYIDGGTPVAPFTDVAGLFARQAAHGSQPPYDAPERWDARKAALDLATPFNLVTTNDIVGGNSGSPVVNRKAEVVGLVFDGNIQSLPGYFIYDGSVNRTVAVDARAIAAALRKVYDAAPLADELQGVAVAAPATAGRWSGHPITMAGGASDADVLRPDPPRSRLR